MSRNETGRVTIPTDVDMVPQTLDVLKLWGADAIRDCDGTEFPAAISCPRVKDDERTDIGAVRSYPFLQEEMPVL